MIESKIKLISERNYRNLPVDILCFGPPDLILKLKMFGIKRLGNLNEDNLEDIFKEIDVNQNDFRKVLKEATILTKGNIPSFDNIDRSKFILLDHYNDELSGETILISFKFYQENRVIYLDSTNDLFSELQNIIRGIKKLKGGNLLIGDSKQINPDVLNLITDFFRVNGITTIDFIEYLQSIMFWKVPVNYTNLIKYFFNDDMYLELTNPKYAMSTSILSKGYQTTMVQQLKNSILKLEFMEFILNRIEFFNN